MFVGRALIDADDSNSVENIVRTLHYWTTTQNMVPNPPLGGLMSAIFYLPYRKVRHWAWESYWLAGGVFSWIVAPWIIALLAMPNLLRTLAHAPATSVFWNYFFGVLWGVGGLMFGLTVRYLGFALGTAMALGYCATFGTLLPPMFNGEL